MAFGDFFSPRSSTTPNLPLPPVSRVTPQESNRVMASTVCDTVLGVELNSERYVSLLRDMIAVSESVQNGPALGLVPNEDKVRTRA